MFLTHLHAPDFSARDRSEVDDWRIAKEEFEKLVGKSELDGTGNMALLYQDDILLTCHCFDARPESRHNWRGRGAELQALLQALPQAAPVGGARRAGAGRPVQTGDGGPQRRRAVTLDDTTVAALVTLGDGALSEGIRRAARALGRHGQLLEPGARGAYGVVAKR